MSENVIGGAGLVGIVAHSIFMWWMGRATGKVEVETKWEEATVKLGHAEYYLDENNQRQWRWKEIKQ